MPDEFKDQDSPDIQLAEAGLDADGIERTILEAMGKTGIGHNAKHG
ncbi:MAG: hypothetical protein R3261_10965, partial [Alphaproteobacteria bacterium]|nr:hypothetical protein [Alphaproteobacteria bacterium]